MQDPIFEQLAQQDLSRQCHGSDCPSKRRRLLDRTGSSLLATLRSVLIVAVVGIAFDLNSPTQGWCCVVQIDGNDDDLEEVKFKLYRPIDHEVFPAATRAVSIIGTKPLGPSGLLRIQDPLGNLAEIHYTAVRTFFNSVLDNGGAPLPAGEWEATLCDGLDPLRAKDHIHFVIEAGDPPQAFPTIDIPHDGEVYPGNLPFIDFIGVASPDSTVWLRIYRVSTQEKVLEIEVEGTVGFMWGYPLMWAHGPGEYLAGVAPTSSDVSDYLSDSTTFEILERGEEDWPYFMPFKFLW